MNAEHFGMERRKLGLTQAELARKLHVHKITVCKWETGRHRIPESAVYALLYMAIHRKQEGNHK